LVWYNRETKSEEDNVLKTLLLSYIAVLFILSLALNNFQEFRIFDAFFLYILSFYKKES